MICRNCRVSSDDLDAECWMCGSTDLDVGVYRETSCAWRHSMRYDIIAPAYIGSFDLTIEPTPDYV